MPEYSRPSLVSTNPSEVADHLLGKGISSTIRRIDGDALYITIAGSSASLDAALADFPNTGRVPLPGGLPAHLQHLGSYFSATPAQLAALTQAQKDHVLQDVIRALKALVDDRLG